MTVGLLRSCTIPVFPHLHLALVFPPLLAFRSDQITAELARSCTIRLQLIGRDRTHLPGVNTSPIATRNAFAAASASRSYASELRQVFANGMAPLIAPLQDPSRILEKATAGQLHFRGDHPHHVGRFS
jgi:hypothetical protein